MCAAARETKSLLPQVPLLVTHPHPTLPPPEPQVPLDYSPGLLFGYSTEGYFCRALSQNIAHQFFKLVEVTPDFDVFGIINVSILNIRM